MVECQVNISDAAKLRFLIRSTFEVSAVPREVWHCRGELELFLFPMSTAGIASAVVHFSKLMNLLICCYAFAIIQKTVVDQISSRPPNRDHYLFWCRSDFRESFELPFCPATEVSYTMLFFHMSQSDPEMVFFIKHNTTIFLVAYEAPTCRAFLLSNLLQMLNNHTVVNNEFSNNLLLQL